MISHAHKVGWWTHPLLMLSPTPFMVNSIQWASSKATLTVGRTMLWNILVPTHRSLRGAWPLWSPWSQKEWHPGHSAHQQDWSAWHSAAAWTRGHDLCAEWQKVLQNWSESERCVGYLWRTDQQETLHETASPSQTVAANVVSTGLMTNFWWISFWVIVNHPGEVVLFLEVLSSFMRGCPFL